MFLKFMPDIYQKSIFSINYNKLKASGIKCLVFDLDNTISPITVNVPDKKTKELFVKLKSLGFKCLILSNSGKRRVEPFKNALSIDAGFSSRKPKSDKYLKIMNNYNFNPNQIAVVGDQLLTDVYGANKVGITSILVNQMGAKDFKKSFLNRIIESVILRSFYKRDLLIKGRYYD